MEEEREIPKKQGMQTPHLAEEVRTDELMRMMADRPNEGGSGDEGSLMSRPRAPKGVPKPIVWAAAGLIVLFIGGFGLSYYVARRELASAVSAREESLRTGMDDLRNFDFSGAESEFSPSAGTPGGLPAGWLGALSSLFSGSGNAFGAFTDLSNQLSSLTQNIANAQTDLWTAIAAVPITNGNPAASSSAAGAVSGVATGTSPLVGDLKGMQTSLAAIEGDMNQLSGVAAAFGTQTGISVPAAGGDGGSYLAFNAEIGAAEQFLNAFVPWFADASSTHHVLVLLENPSEMRPGGGFLGSYADVSISGGAITGIAVHDIADVDSSFNADIVPPQPLQLEETGLRPADGNWFLDFPTSASETIALFEQSKMYAGSSTTFDGAIALTPQAMADILSVTGPISIPDSDLGVALPKGSGASTSTTFTSDGLTEQIQSVVQEGQASSKSSAAPKSVIGFLWRDVLGELASSTSDEQQQLLSLAENWVANKDAMAYFKNPDIENFIQQSGAGGDEYAFPEDFNGDYLAVSNTDINSDKSELYVSSTIEWIVELGTDGTATDHLAIIARA